MRIGVMVGKNHDGSFEYVGKPGDVSALNDIMETEVLKGNFVKLWIGDISTRPLKAKKCVGAASKTKSRATKSK
jgi:hypothetical protein